MHEPSQPSKKLTWYGPIPYAVIDHLTDPKKTYGIIVANMGTVGSVRACGCQERGLKGQIYLAPCEKHAQPAVTQVFAEVTLPAVLRDPGM